MMSQKHQTNPGEKEGFRPAKTGNASNPSAADPDTGGSPLLDAKAEKYLREAANIEDMPDPEEQQEAEQTLSKEGGKQP